MMLRTCCDNADKRLSIASTDTLWKVDLPWVSAAEQEDAYFPSGMEIFKIAKERLLEAP